MTVDASAATAVTVAAAVTGVEAVTVTVVPAVGKARPGTLDGMLHTPWQPLDFIGSGVEITVYSLAGNEAIKYKTHERVACMIAGQSRG